MDGIGNQSLTGSHFFFLNFQAWNRVLIFVNAKSSAKCETGKFFTSVYVTDIKVVRAR